MKNAIAGLKEKPTEPETPEVDKSKLQAKVDGYSKLDSDIYTQESWGAFVDVLEDANAVLADEKATQETVDAMLQSLEEAYGKLEVADTPDPHPEVDNTAAGKGR